MTWTGESHWRWRGWELEMYIKSEQYMRQVLGPGVLGRPRGIGWRGRGEGASGWGIHVNPWLILVNV